MVAEMHLYTANHIPKDSTWQHNQFQIATRTVFYIYLNSIITIDLSLILKPPPPGTMSPFYPNEPFWSNHYHKTNPEIPKIHQNSTSSGETPKTILGEGINLFRNLDFPKKKFGGFSLPKPLPFAASNRSLEGHEFTPTGLPVPKPGSAASKPSMLLTFTGGLGLGPHPAGGRTNHPSERRVE